VAPGDPLRCARASGLNGCAAPGALRTAGSALPPQRSGWPQPRLGATGLQGVFRRCWDSSEAGAIPIGSGQTPARQGRLREGS